jgi:hypothetical protein
LAGQPNGRSVTFWLWFGERSYLPLQSVSTFIVFPYGMRKLFGWFGGPGIDGTLKT